MGETNIFTLGVKADLSHDAVVIAAFSKALRIYEWAVERRVVEAVAERASLNAVPEHEVSEQSYVDLAVFSYDRPILFVEVKSKQEAQSASAWTRQIRRYAKEGKAPCILCVAHDLGEVQKKYLALVNVQVVDLRTL